MSTGIPDELRLAQLIAPVGHRTAFPALRAEQPGVDEGSEERHLEVDPKRHCARKRALLHEVTTVGIFQEPVDLTHAPTAVVVAEACEIVGDDRVPVLTLALRGLTNEPHADEELYVERYRQKHVAHRAVDRREAHEISEVETDALAIEIAADAPLEHPTVGVELEEVGTVDEVSQRHPPRSKARR